MALVCMALITGANGQNTEALSDMPPPCGSFTYDASMDYFPDKVASHIHTHTHTHTHTHIHTHIYMYTYTYTYTYTRSPRTMPSTSKCRTTRTTKSSETPTRQTAKPTS
jgi:hypothetical protein